MFHDADADEVDLHGHARAGPGRRRAEPRRSAPPAGPRAAEGGEGVVRAGARARSSEPAPPSPRTTTTSRASPARAGTPRSASRSSPRPRSRSTTRGERCLLDHGSVVIAAITSCTNTSNPAVMVAAGLLRQARARARPRVQALGQDEPRARLEGRDRLLRAGGPDRPAGAARLQPRRLRLHDLHRELGAAARGDLRRDRSRATSPSCPCSRATATSRGASTPR